MKAEISAPPAPRVIRIRLWSEMAVIFLLFSELIWMSAFYTALSVNQVPWLKVVLILALVVLVSHYLARFLNHSGMDDRRRRIIFIAWLVIALFGSLRVLAFSGQRVSLIDVFIRPFFGITRNETASFAQFWHLILVSILIWRGVSKAREPVTIVTAVRSFQFGLLIFLVYGLIIAPLQKENHSILYLGLFLFFGLLAMTSARISVVSDLRGGKIGKFSRQWMAGLAGAAAGLVGAAIGISLLARGPLTFVIQKVLGVLFIALAAVTLVFTYPLVWLFNLLGPFLDEALANFPGLSFLKEIESQVAQLTVEQTNMLEQATGAVTLGRSLLRIGAVVLVLLIIIVALRWKPAPRRAVGEEEVSDVDRRFKLPRLPDLDPRRVVYRLTHAGRLLAAARIRQIYTELGDLCAAVGHPRPEAATPQEFLPTLNDLFPDQKPGLELITSAYQKIRYGELPESPREVQQAEQAWNAIRRAGRELMVEQRRAKMRSGSNG